MTMYTVGLKDLDYICKMKRDKHDRNVWYCDGAFFREKGTLEGFVPQYVITLMAKQIVDKTMSDVFWFKTEREARQFRDGAVAFKSYLCNKLMGHDGGL